MPNRVIVVGAGLAGSEAAWQLASRGVPVRLYEMRPVQRTPAHRSSDFAELVCSNSLRGASLENAVGLLKEEMRRLGSLVMAAADRHRVPAGGALAVDREGFSGAITQALAEHPLVEVRREEVASLPEEGPTLIATGPLTSDALSQAIQSFLGEEYLSFFDAAAPVVTAESIDESKVFRASRYGKGEEEARSAYINCPMTREEYYAFREALITAEKAQPHLEGEACYFEGCLPIEEIARRGPDTLAYGPLKPVGLTDPRTGRRPFAVVQLRQDNAAATLYNIVGFQTSLKWPEQKRVFGLIPGLEKAEFVRYGVMHRNTFIKSPRVLLPTYQTRQRLDLFFAGQMTGVEGYVESAAAGLVAGLNLARLALGGEAVVFPEETAIGSLAHYITHADADHFQPMNATFGIMPPLAEKVRDKSARKRALAERALSRLESFCREQGINVPEPSIQFRV
ncbi:MAG: methylenetetrahydrofolate--tRNA-(uracil(54)-C(5))-methyltransferase (FADH(2)-oxidizing) TrmFO [Bacillota bacterium]